MIFISDCQQDKKVNKLKILKTRKQKSILDCRRRCQENPYCDYFKFKVCKPVKKGLT